MNVIFKVHVPYALLALAVMAPLLLPGYILTLDTVFVPWIAMPSTVGNDYLWQVLLRIINSILPSQIIEKLIFVLIIYISALGMHRFVEWLSRTLPNKNEYLQWSWPPYIGGLLYAVNPFTYDRFMAGQYDVLIGYALLPFFIRYFMELTSKPTKGNCLKVVFLSLTISIVSLPTLGECVLAAVVIVLCSLWHYRIHRKLLINYIRLLFLGLGFFIVCSCYWIIPLLLGKGQVAVQLQHFTTSDTAAFFTVGTNFASRFASVLRLQGFWAESHHLFTMPQEVLPLWGTVRLIIWALVTVGYVMCWRRSRYLATMLFLLGLTSACIGSGLFSAQLTHLGYREPQKFVGLLAFVFVIFVSLATTGIATWATQKSETAGQIVIVSIAFVILIFTPTMYWGFASQLRPREYPGGWFTVNDYLKSRPGAYRVVFLPWHEYMSFHFAGRIIANPGTRFFGSNVVISNNPELGSIQPPANVLAAKIGKLVYPPYHAANITAGLAEDNVRYVILAKDYDYNKYESMLRQSNFRLVQSTPSIDLYVDTSWKGEM